MQETIKGTISDKTREGLVVMSNPLSNFFSLYFLLKIKVRYCTNVHWTSHFFRFTRKTRPRLIGHPVPWNAWFCFPSICQEPARLLLRCSAPTSSILKQFFNMWDADLSIFAGHILGNLGRGIQFFRPFAAKFCLSVMFSTQR